MKSDEGKKRQGPGRGAKTHRSSDSPRKSSSSSGRTGTGKPRWNSDRPDRSESFSNRSSASKTRTNSGRPGRDDSYSDRSRSDKPSRTFSDRPDRRESFSGRTGTGKPRWNSDRPNRSESYSGRGGTSKPRWNSDRPDRSEPFSDRPRRTSSDRPDRRESFSGRTGTSKTNWNSDRPNRSESYSGRGGTGKPRWNSDRPDRSDSYSDRSRSDKPRRTSGRPDRSESFSDRSGSGKTRRTSDRTESYSGGRNTTARSPKRSSQKQESNRSQNLGGIKSSQLDEPVRLNRYIALCGETSRRKADELIADGAVSVNGHIVTELGIKIDPEKDEIAVSGKPIRQTKHKLYILLHKPKDILTTSSDELNRRTVLDIINIDERIYPIGRLDRNTTGVLVLTNDGDLAHRLMHPSFGVEKEYVATLDQKCTKDDIQKLRTGFRLKDTGEKVSPCNAKILDDGRTVWLSIHEGKNHQVHRMFWTLGYNVDKLVRIAYGGIGLGNLKRGEWRPLTQREVNRLHKMVSLDTQNSNPQKKQPKQKESA
ncbi:MAG: pseudouridine synthase [Chlorobiales bacterium]|nr:pseudouridine synthase [Chlorobiales bacterium]